jgi:hypothetical protein
MQNICVTPRVLSQQIAGIKKFKQNEPRIFRASCGAGTEIFRKETLRNKSGE